MSATLAVALLCLRRGKWLPLGALLLGAFGAWSRLDPQNPATLAMGLTHTALLAALACVVPAIIAPTEAGARHDFLFTLPAPWWAVWTGRAAAYIVVAAASLLLLALPPLLTFGVYSQWLTARPWQLEVILVLFAALSGLATPGYASYRAGRPIATAANALAVLAGVAALYLFGRAASHPLTGPGADVRAVLAAMIAVPVVAYSVAYLSLGRGEPVRAAVAGAVAATVAFVPALLVAGFLTLGV